MTREAMRAAAQAEVDRWEAALSDELVRLFDRQEAVVLARLTGTKARKHTRHWSPPGERKIDARYVLDVARWVTDAAAAARPVLGRLFGKVYKRVAEQVTAAGPDGPSAATPLLGDDDPRLTTAVDDRLARVGDGVKTAAEEVQDYIDREEAAGTPMPQIAEGVRALYAARKDTWAQRIATVSAVGAINHAGLLAAMDAGSSAKQWLSSRDDKVRPTHRKADGQVRLLDERFRLGNIPEQPRRSLLMFPGDPAPTVPIDEVINCRCTLLFSPPRKRAVSGSPAAAAKADEEPLEVKDRVRTAEGAEHYGQPIGTVIRRDKAPLAPTFSAPTSPAGAAAPVVQAGPAVGTIPGVGVVDEATNDPAVLRLVAKFNPSLSLMSTRTVALRDSRGRVGGFVTWQSTDGPGGRAGTVLAVSVHPSLRGQRVGDQLVAIAQSVDPQVRPSKNPAPRRTAATGGQGALFGSPPPRGGSQAATRPPAARPAAKPQRPVGPDGLPVIADRRKAGDLPGTSGDFDADSKRIGRLQKAYLADGADTTALFSRGGRWSPEREKAQQAIIDHFLGQPGVKADGKLLVLGGVPGAGKTTTINSPQGQAALGIDLGDYVTVNADEVKDEMVKRGMVPDYPGLSPEEAATLYHAESFEIAHSLMRQAARRGLNFAYDTSLKSSAQAGFATSAARASKKHYEATFVFVDVPVPTARSRAKARYLAGGRFMPLGLIDALATSSGASVPSREFNTVKRSERGRWFVFDNAGAAPTLVGQGMAGSSKTGGGRGGGRP